MASILDVVRELETISLKPSNEEIAAYKKILSMMPQWESELREAERAGLTVRGTVDKLLEGKSKLEKLLSVYG